MVTKTVLLYLAILQLSKGQAASTPNYIGGNNFNFINTNPNYIYSFLNSNSFLSAAEIAACATISSTGLPIAAIKKVLLNVDQLLNSTNQNSFVKLIFETSKLDTKTQKTNYKIALQIKTTTSVVYLAVEAVVNPFGYPGFEILTYHLDADINMIRLVLNEQGVDPNQFFGCGDVKAIYSAKTDINPAPNLRGFGINSNQANAPYNPQNNAVGPNGLQNFNNLPFNPNNLNYLYQLYLLQNRSPF